MELNEMLKKARELQEVQPEEDVPEGATVIGSVPLGIRPLLSLKEDLSRQHHELLDGQAAATLRSYAAGIAHKAKVDDAWQKFLEVQEVYFSGVITATGYDRSMGRLWICKDWLVATEPIDPSAPVFSPEPGKAIGVIVAKIPKPPPEAPAISDNDDW